MAKSPMPKERKTRLLSTTTIEETVEPKNPDTLFKQLNFAVDYQRQQALVPGKGFMKGLGNAQAKAHPINRNGEAACGYLTDSIGGSNDDDPGVF